MIARRIEVHVDRIVLHGFPVGVGDDERLRVAISAALAEGLAGVTPAAYSTTDDASRRTTVRLAAGAAPSVTGAALGRAVAATLTPAPQPGRGGR